MLGELALNPFSVGLATGAIAGVFHPASRSYRLSPYIAFATWLAAVAAAHFGAQLTPSTIIDVLEVGALWGGVPFALCFLASRALVGFVRKRLF